MTSTNSFKFVEEETENLTESSNPLVQKSGHVDDDVQISALDVFYEKDERDNRCIGKVLERYRGKDAGDLKRSELDELVGNWTCLNALGRKNWKFYLKILMDEKSWKTWKSNQKIVMDEELVQNIVMDEELIGSERRDG